MVIKLPKWVRDGYGRAPRQRPEHIQQSLPFLWLIVHTFHGVYATLLVPRARTATGQRTAASLSMDDEHGTVCHPILEHQIRPSAPSSVISRSTCFSSSLRCCWQVGSAPFVRRRCDCLASSAPFTNIQTYLLTYLLTYLMNIHWCPTRQSTSCYLLQQHIIHVKQHF